MTKVRTLLVVALAIAGPAPGAMAAAPSPGTTFGDWAVECDSKPDGSPACVISQTQLLKESGARLLKLSLGFIGPNGDPLMVATLPLGIDLRAGAAAQPDDRSALPLTLQQCLQDGCIATHSLDPKGLEALLRAKVLHIKVLPYGSQQPVTITASLKGVTAGLEALK